MGIVSSFILALFVLLASFKYLEWFGIDPRLIGFVGIAFVIVFMVEALKPIINWPRK